MAIIIGTDAGETLNGTAEEDTIFGLGGNDALNGGAGNDTMIGGTGNDVYHVDSPGDRVEENTGEGRDVVYASVSYTLTGGSEVEVLSTNALGATTAINLAGNAFAQVIYGNAGVNSLNGGGGNDTLVGLAGSDILNGSTGNDTMIGGTGNDVYHVDSPGDRVRENTGEGRDVVYASVSYTLTGGSEVEVLSTSSLAATTPINLTGNEFAQVLYGNAGANGLDGGGGNDTLVGLGGDDILNGGMGDDTLIGDDDIIGGDDTYYVDSAGDIVREGRFGRDVVYASVSYALTGDGEIEVLSTSALGDTTPINLTGNRLGQAIYGNAGANVLVGGGGGDTLLGLGGDDVLIGDYALIGGTGNDIYYLDWAPTILTEHAGEGHDVIYTGVDFGLPGDAEVEVLSTKAFGSTDPIDIGGNGFNQIIYGNAGANSLYGGGGNDTLAGFGGDDILDGGTGTDKMDGGAGDDRYYVDTAGDVVRDTAGGGSDIVFVTAYFTTGSFTLRADAEIERLKVEGSQAAAITGNGFAQSIEGSDGNDSFDGGGGNDVLSGWDGDDVLFGGSGDDWMFGEDGNDTYYVDSAGDTVREDGFGHYYDVVYTSVSYALALATDVEVLSTDALGATSAINLAGNDFAQSLYGNAGTNSLGGLGGNDTLVGLGGNDTLDGGTGNDTLIGGAGDDAYYVDAAGDTVQESAGEGTDAVYAAVSYALTAEAAVEILGTTNDGGTTATDLTGSAFAQVIYGNAGANVLNGGGGNDTLVGLGGADTFAFTTALGAGNVDTLAGYSVADDTIQLDDAVFTGLAAGALAAGAFNTGAAASEADDRIIYDSASGALLFDADGTGAGAAVQFATLAAGLALTAGEFVVI